VSSLEEYKRLNTRRASLVNVGGFRPTGELLASNFGLQPVGLPGDEWPTFKGKPLLFVCQLNLTTAPTVPAVLGDIKVITFFINADLGSLGEENGQGWSLRAYNITDGLVPLTCPLNTPKVKCGFECQWEGCDDHPSFDDPEVIVPAGFDPSEVQLENLHRTKIGGYASNIQSEQWWNYRAHSANPKYCFQIDSEDKVGLVWGDSGTIYLARGTVSGLENQWFLDWQCC
jgi:uncharacterized protein YwqG